jgi:hypothetical protein
MIEVFLFGSYYSWYTFNNYLNNFFDKQKSENSQVGFPRSEFYICHIHIIVYSLCLLIFGMYVTVLTSTLLVHLGFEKKKTNLLSQFIGSHVLFEKICNHFVYNMMMIIICSTAVHALVVLFFMVSNQFVRIKEKPKAKLELVVTSIMSYVTISLIIIFAIHK